MDLEVVVEPVDLWKLIYSSHFSLKYSDFIFQFLLWTNCGSFFFPHLVHISVERKMWIVKETVENFSGL